MSACGLSLYDKLIPFLPYPPLLVGVYRIRYSAALGDLGRARAPRCDGPRITDTGTTRSPTQA